MFNDLQQLFFLSFRKHNNFIMPKMLILNMQDQYPFYKKSNLPQPSSDTSIVVRQSVNVIDNNRNNLIAKATFIKNLRNRNLIRQHYIHILYQYISSDIDWKNQQLIKNLHNQIKQFIVYLCNIGVKISLFKNRIGVSETGLIKYFIGLEFQWEDSSDEKVLNQHYQHQLKRLFRYHSVEKQFLNKTNQLVPYKQNKSQENKKEGPNRKVQFTTLPSRYNRLIKIDEQLNNIKTSNKDFTFKTTKIFQDFVRRQSTQQNLQKKPFDFSPLNKIKRKIQDRKYSGDNKLDISSKKRLKTKQNDINSQLSRDNRSITYQINRSQIQTTNTKKRIQQMKYKEYKQIKKINKNYLKEFIQVLQDDENEVKSVQKKINPQYKMQNIENSVVVRRDTNLLQNKAKQAINNSLKAIKKFKSLGI